MPKVNPRRPYYDERPDGPLESLNDWYKSNTDAVEWFLENAEELRLILSTNRYLLTMTTVELSSRNFTYYAPTRTFSADISDFISEFRWDSAPQEITIRSSKTGKRVEFFLKGRLQDNEDTDGELVGYEYESLDGYKIHLYND